MTFFRDNDGASRGGRCAPAAENHTTGGGAPRVVGSCVPLLVRMAVAGGSYFFRRGRVGCRGGKKKDGRREKAASVHQRTGSVRRSVGRRVWRCSDASTRRRGLKLFFFSFFICLEDP